MTEDGRTIDILSGWGSTVRDRRATAATKTAPEGIKGNRTSLGVVDQPGAGGGTKKAFGNAASSSEQPEAPELPVNGQFLGALHAGACEIFSTVLGPDANAA